MSQPPPRVCPKCRVPHRERRCPRCAKAFDAARGSARSRGYDSDWQRVRARKLAATPWCECDRCLLERTRVQAVDVDHRDGNPRNNAWSNLRSMAHGHHSRRTAIDQSGWGKRDE